MAASLNEHSSESCCGEPTVSPSSLGSSSSRNDHHTSSLPWETGPERQENVLDILLLSSSSLLSTGSPHREGTSVAIPLPRTTILMQDNDVASSTIDDFSSRQDFLLAVIDEALAIVESDDVGWNEEKKQDCGSTSGTRSLRQ